MQHLTSRISVYKHFTKTLIPTEQNRQTDRQKSLNKWAFNIQQ